MGLGIKIMVLQSDQFAKYGFKKIRFVFLSEYVKT